MTTIVLDASVALRACIPHEASHEAALDKLAALASSGIEPIAPDLFPYEVGNAIRRMGGTATERMDLLLDILQLVRLVRPTVDALARAQASPAKLTYYDAVYVALAEEHATLLWTEDAAILRAAPDVARSTDELSIARS